MANKFMVFDVESVGLHGEGFAVGFVVVNSAGDRLDEGVFACPFNSASGSEEGFRWCRKNIPEIKKTHTGSWSVRAAFWQKWMDWKAEGAVLVADCAWPVEARFLARCVDDDPIGREWQGPYPLHDLASVMLALGVDALAETERLPDELPPHHPLMDARQTARQLVACLKANNRPEER